MEIKNDAVINDQGAATGAEVKTVQDASTENDLLKQLAEKDALLAKSQADKENYKKGLLASKGKLKTDDGEEIDIQDIVRQAVHEQFASREVDKIQAEKDEIIKNALREKDELIIALKNRSQIATGQDSASGEGAAKVSDNILSQEKINQFKKMGWIDEKIETYKKNLMKNRGFN